jgi:hypothetical protein
MPGFLFLIGRPSQQTFRASDSGNLLFGMTAKTVTQEQSLPAHVSERPSNLASKFGKENKGLRHFAAREIRSVLIDIALVGTRTGKSRLLNSTGQLVGTTQRGKTCN